ncbi:predicted protein [Sclerotinia sclerotiorum 1980 UF-70]|uniref:Uncharacterized protein n=1 Tax=Sclerotinia sclerotiorum (strain ATCC 18683 / 1980 / Ss-1) TaxID=665079 RepID=A7EIY4_SCLS1|nr:predicted protein [Sclerotinia sclerotiorum 1980 UF-70]EDO02800.1 predicted protein [Sclerotinia sclerotiorum 1980 UF-70]
MAVSSAVKVIPRPMELQAKPGTKATFLAKFPARPIGGIAIHSTEEILVPISV